MEIPAVRVEIVFLDCKHHSRIKTVLHSVGLYDIDHYMSEAINGSGLSPDPGDEFDLISYKVFNLSYVENLPPLDPKLYQSKI